MLRFSSSCRIERSRRVRDGDGERLRSRDITVAVVVVVDDCGGGGGGGDADDDDDGCCPRCTGEGDGLMVSPSSNSRSTTVDDEGVFVTAGVDVDDASAGFLFGMRIVLRNSAVTVPVGRVNLSLPEDVDGDTGGSRLISFLSDVDNLCSFESRGASIFFVVGGFLALRSFLTTGFVSGVAAAFDPDFCLTLYLPIMVTLKIVVSIMHKGK